MVDFIKTPWYLLFLTQIDAVGKPSWQAQIKGTKQWILEPPPECYFKCKSPKHVVVVQPGDISKFSVCLSVNTS